MIKNISKYVISLILFISSTGLFGQTLEGVIRGKILDKNNDPIPFATIAVKNASNGTVSDVDGNFQLAIKNKNSVTLIIRSIGYREITKEIQHQAYVDEHVVTLEESTTKINEAVVTGKSQITRKKELPFTVTAINVKQLQSQNLDVNQVLNATTGVRIREEGGLGSGFNFSLNGFSGNQVKFFLDGVPMDNFGSSLTLNNIPVNLISSVEVYKGVVPIHLGSDALGGAVNIITNDNIRNYIDASYSYGSFNTHRAALVSRFTNEKTGITVNANAFYNYSDNDYEMTLSVASIENGGKYGAPEKIRRFHDAYESRTAQVEIGFMNKKFADRLFFGVIVSDNYKELQTGHNMNIVIGEAYQEDKVIIPTFKYKKKNFVVKDLDVSVFANFNVRQALSADTSSRQYDWYQNYTIKGVTATSGELAWYKTLFRYNDNSSLVTSNISYQISPMHSFSVNNTYSSFRRVGEDPIALSAVPFSKPNTLNKNITGFAYNLNLLNNKLKTVGFAKFFQMESVGFEGDYYSQADTSLTKINASYTYKAFGMASTYFITQSTQVKASFEKTFRLPEGDEMFGNGLSLLSNLEIKPEESRNFNFGILSNNSFKQHWIQAEFEYLYRLPENMIRYKAEGNEGTYVNQVSVRGYSMEGGIKYNYDGKINAEINGTYQKLVHNNKKTPTGGTNHLYNRQLANIPYLFGNVILGYRFNDLFAYGNYLSLNWSTLFVEAFYLKSPSNGDPAGKNDIPRQISHTASIAYSMRNGKYTLSLACSNLTDNELFDNWKLPKPGRAFNVKLRYYFSN